MTKPRFTEDSLRQEMIRSIAWRGHGNISIETLNERVKEYTCGKCGMSACTDTNPAPNGIEIGGTMVALDCEPTQRRQLPTDPSDTGGRVNAQAFLRRKLEVEATEAAGFAGSSLEAHRHEWGEVKRSFFTGNPYRSCKSCEHITLDLDSDDDGVLGICGCTDYHYADCPTRQPVTHNYYENEDY